MVSTGVAIIVVALILVSGGIFYAVASGVFSGQPNQLSVNVGTISTTKFEDPTKTPTNLGTGDILNVDFVHFDSLTNDPKTEGTTVETSILGATASGYSLRATGTNMDYQLQSADGGLLTIITEPKSGQAFILDRDEVQNRNPGRIESMQYYDWDDDGDRQWLLRLNTKYLKPVETTTQTPQLQVYLPWHNENTLTLNTPLDQTGIALAAGTTVNIYWEGTGTSGDATYFNYVIYRVNNTNTDLIDTGNSYIQVTADGYSKRLVLSDGAESKTSTDREWKWTLNTNKLGDADYVEFKPNAGTKVYFSAKIAFDLTANQNINNTLDVSTWDASGTPNTLLTDTVKITGAAS